MIITITGKLASGKTTLSKHYRRKGARIINADELGKKILKSPNAKTPLAEEFGNEILEPDGSINSKKLARKAFADRKSLGILNSITHPLLKEEIKKELRKAKQIKEEIVIIDAALLTELELDKVSDLTITVTCSDESAAARIPPEKRQNLLRRRAYQKEPKGDFLIENNGTIVEFLAKADKLWNELIKNEKNKQDRNISRKL